MIGTMLSNIMRFIVLVLLQALVIDHMDVANGWVVPYVYVLFILMLPIALPLGASLLLGFTVGLTMDLFSSTPGMHASACTVMAYGRTLMLMALAPREGYEIGRRAALADMGLPWFMTYAGVLILIHHLWLFFVEVFRFDAFFSTLLRALLSTGATLVLCLVAQLLIARSSSRAR